MNPISKNGLYKKLLSHFAAATAAFLVIISIAGNSALADAGSSVIVRNGMLLTFGQARLRLEEPAMTAIPGLSQSLSLTTRIALSANTRGALLRALQPSQERRYFNIRPEELTEAKRKELIAAYERTIGESTSNESLVLVAVTIGSETFLLPEFYQLSDDIARAAILMHEALWVVNSKLSLRTVLRTEIAVEKILRSNPGSDPIAYDYDFMQILKEAFRDPYLGITAAVVSDFSQGPVTIRFPNWRAPISRTLSTPVFSLQEIVGADVVTQMGMSYRMNPNLIYNHAFELLRLNPKLAFPRELLAESKKFNLIRLYGKEHYLYLATYRSKDDRINGPQPGRLTLGQLEVSLLMPYSEVNAAGKKHVGYSVKDDVSQRQTLLYIEQ